MVALPGDFRWHAFTVIAVILAFGLGVLAGVALPHESMLLERQQALVQRLEAEFQHLRADNQRLADWAARQAKRDQVVRDGTRRLVHLAAAGRLAGRQVLVLARGPSPEELAADLTATLVSAGAEPTWTATDQSWPGLLDDVRPQGVVVLDAAVAEPLDALLAEVRRRLGAVVPVVVATLSESRAAQVARLEMPLTVVDHPADPLGQIAIVLGLLGIEGYYGYGAAADGPLPPASASVPALGEGP